VVQATTGIFDMDPERRENPVFFDWTVGLVGAAIMAFALVWLAGKNWPWLRARIRRWRRSGK
jgi:hypothetical protein